LFTLSSRGVYGLTAMLELSLRHNQGPIQIKDIAAAHDIPQHYLEQLLVSLKKAGFVESSRGPQGGYVLARKPSEIQVLDILTILDGKLEIVRGERQGTALSFFWGKLEEDIREMVAIDLETLVYEKQRSEEKIVYNI
jgi:Rrf2 family cysteine metabolism transcriptional repressor